MAYTSYFPNASIDILTNKRIKFIYKVILVGDSGVGKTSLAQRYTLDIFNPSEQNTIGVSYVTKRIFNKDKNEETKLCIWDTAGQERFFSIVKLYFTQAKGAVCVYDVNSIQSLRNCEKWINEIEKYTQESEKIYDNMTSNILNPNINTNNYSKLLHIPIVLVGNKIDLFEKTSDIHLKKNREERQKIIDNLQTKYNVLHFETSAKNDKGIEEVFNVLIDMMVPNTIDEINDITMQNNTTYRTTCFCQ